MDISEIRIRLCDEGKLKCFANITFDGCFVVRGVKVIQGAEGCFLSMPSRKREDGTFVDIAHPINMEMRRKLEEAVLAAYHSALKDAQEGWNSQASIASINETIAWPNRLRHSG